MWHIHMWWEATPHTCFSWAILQSFPGRPPFFGREASFFCDLALFLFSKSCDMFSPHIGKTSGIWQRIKDTNFDIFFSTCFWPTTTCLFFLPSMVAGIRHMTGDQKWLQLSSQLRRLTGSADVPGDVPGDPRKSPEFPYRLVSRTPNNEVSTIHVFFFAGWYKPLSF